MKILIVAHDAGGAEIVSAWVKANPQHEYRFILQGPAVSIFSRKISQFKNESIENLILILSEINFVLTGTSWGSDLEQEVIKAALEKNVFVASYLDHWINYLERFQYQGTLSLPNEIWVGDQYAENLAKSIFMQVPVRLVPNQYFEEVKKEFKKISASPRSQKYNFLYICEPVEASAIWKAGDKNARNYTEFSALQFFFNELQRLNLVKKIAVIRVRLHPSESRGKYDHIIEKVKHQYSCKLIVGENTSLLEDYGWADYIVGVSSMAMVIASILDKVVFTCIPEDAFVTQLPIDNIRQLNSNLS